MTAQETTGTLPGTTLPVDAAQPGTAEASPAATLPPGPRPLGHGAIAVAGIVLALLTTALGVVGIRDALVRAGALGGRPWLDAAIEWLDGLRPQWWGVPVGAAAVIVGCWLLLAAVRPGPRTALPLASRTGVVLRRRTVNRLAVRAALEVDGVLSARARVSRRRRRVEVSARVTGEPATVTDEVRRSVEERLRGLQPPLQVRVTARTEPTR